MFTGLYPASHGMMPSKTHSADAKHSLTRLDEKLETLAELLKQKGYRTGGVTPNPWTSVEFGYDQGFDDFRFLPRATAGTISSTARELIDRLSGEEAPFFVYAHYLDPHDPYTPPVEYRNRFKDQTLKKDPRTYNPKMLDLLNRYDGEIAFMDKRIGELFSYLKGRGLYDDMVIVVIGDHGEQFMEHGDHRHGFQLYNEEIHVPLLLKADSSRPGKTVDHTVSNVDVFPTLLTLAGIDVPQQLPGVSLLDDRRIASREGVFTEIHRRYYQRAFVTRDGTKLLLGSSEIDRPIDDAVREQIVGVFDRKVDYFERAPLDDQSRLAALKSKLDLTHQLALSRKEWTDNSTEVQDSTVEQLKSLGYLQ
jgi:arylsulfatase A-like enzyme